jgi:signal transduction histidine kinase
MSEQNIKQKAHKLGNAINGIMMACGYARILVGSEDSKENHPDLLMALDDIEKSSKRAGELLDQLIDAAREGVQE